MADESARAAMVPTDRIRMHPRNIRKTFTGLDELAASIRHEGVLEPLVAHQKARRAAGVQDLELIAGHRRLAAAEQAGLSRVPVFIVPTMRDDEAMLAMLAENVQREAVPIRDLGVAITELHDEFGYDFGSIAERLGITLEVLREWRQGRETRPRSAAHADRASPKTLRSRPAARPVPRLRPSAVHDLVQQFDAGELDAHGIVAELRGWLGDWKPAEKPKPPPRPRARLGRRRRPPRRPIPSPRRPPCRSARGGAQVEQERYVRPADRGPHRAEPAAGRPPSGRTERSGSSLMNKTEAIHMNTLLAWLLDVPVNTEPVTGDQALDAAVQLADRVTAALSAGVTSDRVRSEWAESPPLVSRRAICGVQLYEQYGAGPEIDLGSCVLDNPHGGDCMSQVELDRHGATPTEVTAS